MTSREYPSVDLVREVLLYDQDTGIFSWLESRGRVKKGEKAGSIGEQGYVSININGKSYRAHRLAWACVHGAYPKMLIDHIDGDRANNRISNLREATNSENLQNQLSARSDNKSGLIGAMFHKSRNCWRSQIVVNGKQKHLGVFATAELAHAAYVIAKRELHPMGTL